MVSESFVASIITALRQTDSDAMRKWTLSAVDENQPIQLI